VARNRDFMFSVGQKYVAALLAHCLESRFAKNFNDLVPRNGGKLFRQLSPLALFSV
jgi:hypothetical protein